MTATDTRPFDAELESLLAVAEEIRRGERRDGQELRPLGPKAARTRTAVIDAGVDVFCEQGYQASSVSDVHARAGVSLGTFYQYFRDKADLIATIVAEAVITSAPQIFPDFDAERGEAGVVRVVDGFVRHYAATAPFQRVWEEVTHLEPTVAELRARLSRLLETSLASGIAAGQAMGDVDGSLDPRLAARALAAMVDRTCYLTFVLEASDPSAAPAVTEVLSTLWANALGLEER